MIEIEIIANKWQEFDTTINDKSWLLDIILNEIDSMFYISFKQFDQDGNIVVVQGFTKILNKELILKGWTGQVGNFTAIATNKEVYQPNDVSSFVNDFSFLYLNEQELK